MAHELTKEDGRLYTIQRMRVCPWDEVKPILDAKKEGASDWQAANLAGFTRRELNLMLKLGEEGHPAWGLFATEYRKSRAIPAKEMTVSQHTRGINGNQKDIENWQMQNDPEIRDLHQKEIDSRLDSQRIGGFKVVLNRFDAPPEPKQIPETIDVE